MAKTGIVGAVVAAIFCLTPVLVVALGFLGFSVAAGWLDYVLLPAFAVFAVMAGYGMWRRRRRRP
ncbi:MAG: mercury resistance system transport protein MerF [Alphaproteobacteria bacterium]|nr:mercury resistance system transport protein MerF [Alphaproteobacteria bacterium]